MKVQLTETYNVPTGTPVETYERVCIADPRCVVSAYEQIGNDVSVIKNTINDDVLEREILIHPHASSIPALIRAFADKDDFDVIQRTAYDFRSHKGKMTTSMVNPSLDSKFKAKCDLSLRSNGPLDPNKVTYTQDAEVVSKIFMVGGLVEKAVCSELVDRTAVIQTLNQAWIDKKLAEGDDVLDEAVNS